MLSILSSAAYSQGTDARLTSGKNESLFLGLYVNPLMTDISNEVFTDALSSKKGNTINFEFEFGYFFTDIIGISLGAGYSSYAAELSLDSYNDSFGDTDNEGEAYTMLISGKSINENQKLSVLSIPLYINFRIPASDKLGFIIKAGPGFDLPMAKTYDGTGIFTYKGYYPAYPVTIENYPEYFPTDFSTSSSGTLLVKSMNISLVAAGSAYYSLNDNIKLQLGLYFHKSMSNISSYEPVADFKLTSKKDELNSFMGGSSSTGIQAVGLSVGLKYYLK